MINNHARFLNIDTTKNRFSEYPKSATIYYIHYHVSSWGPSYTVVICAYEKKDRYLFKVSKHKIDLMRQFLTNVPMSIGLMRKLIHKSAPVKDRTKRLYQYDNKA